jgi:hypothetical protein
LVNLCSTLFFIPDLKLLIMRTLLFFIVFLGIFLTSGTSNVFSQNNEGWKAPADIVAKLSSNGNAFNYKEENIKPYTLPDVLQPNGAKITSAEQWDNIGRPAISELFRKNVYGRVPSTTYTEKFKTVLDTITLEGAAHQKKIDIEIMSGGKSLIIHLSLFTPANSKKTVPAFLLIDNFKSSIDPKVKDDFFPVKDAINRGYGMAVFSSADLDPDNFDNFKNGIHGLLDKNPRPGDAWGTIAAWAWGASRCMDYLQTDKDINRDKIAIVGHSRGGKTALWAGAEDTRFGMVISNESGAGGAALARRRFGETVEKLNTGFPHWFCSNYSKFNNKEDEMPVDMHMLLALAAPRPLYVACADEDLWGDPRGSYLSLYNAVPVYKLLGYASDIPLVMPSLEKQIISGKVGFHIRGGGHSLLLKDWNQFMDFADIVWK